MTGWRKWQNVREVILEIQADVMVGVCLDANGERVITRKVGRGREDPEVGRQRLLARAEKARRFAASLGQP